MTRSLALALHFLAINIWFGGMFFAYMALGRAAAAQLAAPQRLALWRHTLRRFFFWVWVAVIVMPASGLWMIFYLFGGLPNSPGHILVMAAMGTLMIGIFLIIFFVPFRRFKQYVASQEWVEAGRQLALIRKLVGVNLLLGLTVIVAIGVGHYQF